MRPPSRPCIFCGGPHFDSQCPLCETVEQRLFLASQRGFTCIRCLGKNHTSVGCRTASGGCIFCHSPEHNIAFCQKAIDNQTTWWRKNGCAFCDGRHMDIDCTQYATASARTLQVQLSGRCLGCLAANHTVEGCTVPPNKCIHCHHRALLTGRLDVSPYHNVALCPIKFPDTELASDDVGGSGTREAITGGRCDDHGSSTSQRTELDELKEQLEDEKNQLSAERERLGKADFGVLEREAAVRRREEELAAEKSGTAEERGRIEKAKTRLANLEKLLTDREEKVCEEEAQLSAERAAFEEQQLQAGSSSKLAEVELQMEVVREENRRLHCELAQMTRERDAVIALSEERKGELDQAHKTLSEQFRKRRELRDVYYQREAQRKRLQAEKEALQLSLQFRDEGAQQTHQGSPQTTSRGTVCIKQEVLDASEVEAASAAFAGGKRPSHSTHRSSGTKRPRQQWDEAAVDALKQRLADLANECGGDSEQTVVKYNAFIEANIRRVGNSTALIDFLKRAEPANSSIAERIEQLIKL